MTDLVEVMARAAANEMGHSWDGLNDQTVGTPEAAFLDGQQAAIQALNDGGYAVVPRGPTKRMIDAGRAMFWCGGNEDGEPSTDEATEMAYRAMIAAAEENQ